MTLDATSCTLVLLAAPSFEILGFRTLAEPPCAVSMVAAADFDGDGFDEILAELRDNFASAPDGPHEVRAVLLEAPSLVTRWESERIPSEVGFGDDYDWYTVTFGATLDANADCRRDLVEWHASGATLTRTVRYAPEFRGTPIPTFLEGTQVAWTSSLVRWVSDYCCGPPRGFGRLEIGTDLDGDGSADLFGVDVDATGPPALVIVDARSGEIRWQEDAFELGGGMAADLDGDGRRDLLLSWCPDLGCPSGITTALQGGTLRPLWQLSLPPARQAMFLTDMDEDGWLEVALAGGPVDAATGRPLPSSPATGQGQLGPDFVSRPMHIMGRRALVDILWDVRSVGQDVVQARALDDGSVLWEHAPGQLLNFVPAEFDGDGETDIIVFPLFGAGPFLVDGATGRLRDLSAEVVSILGFQAEINPLLLDVDDDGVAELELRTLGSPLVRPRRWCVVRVTDPLEVLVCSEEEIVGR